MSVEITPVESSNISGIGYDDATSTMIVQFSRGEKYAFTNVERELYDEFLNAASIGSFFHQKIRKALVGVKVEEPDDKRVEDDQ